MTGETVVCGTMKECFLKTKIGFSRNVAWWATSRNTRGEKKIGREGT